MGEHNAEIAAEIARANMAATVLEAMRREIMSAAAGNARDGGVQDAGLCAGMETLSGCVDALASMVPSLGIGGGLFVRFADVRANRISLRAFGQEVARSGLTPAESARSMAVFLLSRYGLGICAAALSLGQHPPKPATPGGGPA